MERQTEGRNRNAKRLRLVKAEEERQAKLRPRQKQIAKQKPNDNVKKAKRPAGPATWIEQ